MATISATVFIKPLIRYVIAKRGVLTNLESKPPAAGLEHVGMCLRTIQARPIFSALR